MNLVDETVHRGHKIEVYAKRDGSHQVQSNILDDPIDVATRFVDDGCGVEKAVMYVKGYINGWKDQGGP